MDCELFKQLDLRDAPSLWSQPLKFWRTGLTLDIGLGVGNLSQAVGRNVRRVMG